MRRYGEGFDLQSLVSHQRAHPSWGGYAARLQDEAGRFAWPRPGKEDDQAHPPIHPVALATDLQGDEKRVRFSSTFCSLSARHKG